MIVINGKSYENRILGVYPNKQINSKLLTVYKET